MGDRGYPPPWTYGYPSHRVQTPEEKAEALRRGASGAAMASQPPLPLQHNASLKGSSPDAASRLVPEFFNEFPLPSPSSTILKVPLSCAAATFGATITRYPETGQASSASSATAPPPAPASSEAYASLVSLHISIHPNLPNIFEISILPPAPPPVKRLPWVKSTDTIPSLPLAPPFMLLHATDSDQISHDAPTNSIHILFSSPSSPSSPSPVPSALVLTFASSEHCIRAGKAFCQSLMLR
jgi:hypothetical protein